MPTARRLLAGRSGVKECWGGGVEGAESKNWQRLQMLPDLKTGEGEGLNNFARNLAATFQGYLAPVI